MIVLDSWALLAYLKDEPAASRIGEVWLSELAESLQCEVVDLRV